MVAVLLTRAEAAAKKTAHLLNDLGHEPVICSLFEIHDTSANIPHRKYDGIILTSKNAVEGLQRRNWIPPSTDIPVFCVGRKTAQAASGLGYGQIKIGEGNAQFLVRAIRDFDFAPESKLLYPTTVDRSFDFSEVKSSLNLEIDAIEIYKYSPLTPPDKEITAALAKVSNGATFLYSIRSGDHFSRLIKTANLERQLSNITCIAISGQVADIAKALPWKKVLIASSSDESSMIELLVAA